ncbi:MAG: carboxypeptidase regulatory-like domain-containing protein [Leptolyngbya sp. SIO3F4]|nr:carboxypeptidase regulatory-like domain-containing protein [Leptolyngbya sp. SIO3F4]
MKSFMFMFGIAVVAAVGFSSCNKEQHIEELPCCPSRPQFQGGGDDEDPILLISVQDEDSLVVVNASVELFRFGQSTPTATQFTNTQGEASFQEAVSEYFVVTSAGGFETDTVSAFSLVGDTTIAVQLQEL